MYKLSFYVVEDYLEPVKNAIFAAGAGEYDNFKNCCWQTKGEGQYQAIAEELKTQIEYKVEIFCQKEKIQQIITALKAAHPCAEPAYAILEMLKLDVG